jgi:hypothetical protein
MTQFKIKVRKVNDAEFIARIFAENQLIYASSTGYFIACALFALGVDEFALEHQTGNHSVRIDRQDMLVGLPEFTGAEYGQTGFWHRVMAGIFLILLQHPIDDQEFRAVHALLPEDLISDYVTDLIASNDLKAA